MDEEKGVYKIDIWVPKRSGEMSSQEGVGGNTKQEKGFARQDQPMI